MTNLEANDTTRVLEYLVRAPKLQSEKPPLIILLHGVGSNEEDLFSFADELPGNYLVVSARAPITLGQGSYAWYPYDFSGGKPVVNLEQQEKARRILVQFITQLKQQLSFNEHEIYLCGFSQGAIMTFSVGLSRPDLVKGIAIMSGRLPDGMKTMIAPKEKLQDMKVFISHGTNDQVLSIEYARKSLAYLKTLNLHPIYKEYSEGHGINNEMFKDLVNWLNK